MTRIARQPLSLLALALGLAVAVSGAYAQPFPSKQVTVIHATPSGATSNIVMQLIAEKFAENTGQRLINEPRPGGLGNVSLLALKQAPADGHTLWAGVQAFLTIFPLVAKVQFDPATDVKPITALVYSPIYLAIPANSPAKSVAELVELSKTRPNGLFVSEPGGVIDENIALFKLGTKARLTGVPYKSAPDALADLVAGRLDLASVTLVGVKPYLDSGRARVLAVISSRRYERTPNVPTVAESGYPEVVLDTWFGLFAPGGTPEGPVRTMQREVAKILSDPKINETLLGYGLRAGGEAPEQFQKTYAASRALSARVIQAAGTKAD